MTNIKSSYLGKPVDMYKLSLQNEKTIALGNANMNARGDILGKGGKIKKTREEVIKSYYEANPKAVTKFGFKKQGNKLFDIEERIAQEVDKPVVEEKSDTSASVKNIKKKVEESEDLAFVKDEEKVDDNDYSNETKTETKGE